MSDRYFVNHLGDATLVGCRECAALVFGQEQHDRWHDHQREHSDGPVCG